MTSQIAGLPKAKAKLLHKHLRAPVATPGYTTNPTTPTRAGGEAPEGAAAAEIAPEKPRRIVPFVPLPSVPIKKPWVMGVETGLKLSEAGNTVVHDGNVGLGLVQTLKILSPAAPALALGWHGCPVTLHADACWSVALCRNCRLSLTQGGLDESTIPTECTQHLDAGSILTPPSSHSPGHALWPHA